MEAVNKLKQTPIIVASVFGHFHICKLLKRKKANIHHKDINGRTSVDYTFL